MRYFRQPRNIGASPNFNICYELASSEYFKWAAHDDFLEPEYLAECVTGAGRAIPTPSCASRWSGSWTTTTV